MVTADAVTPPKLLPAPLYVEGGVAPMFIIVSDEQFWNEHQPISFTSGILISSSNVHPLNALPDIKVTDGMSIVVSAVQLQKTKSLTEVAAGKLTVVSVAEFQNAPAPVSVFAPLTRSSELNALNVGTSSIPSAIAKTLSGSVKTTTFAAPVPV
jgi:hypothetical protein